MINQNTSQRLLSRLGFTLRDLTPDQIGILEFKWGGKDGQFHSSKSVIKRLDLKLSENDIRSLEEKAINIIEKELDRVFVCTNCEVDLRKSGVTKTTTGYQKAKVFISADGIPTRSTDVTFHKENFTSKKQNGYRCGNCDCSIAPDAPSVIFIENRIKQDTILYYMKQFRGVSDSAVAGMNPHEVTELWQEPVFD